MIIKIVTISLMAVFYICYFAKLISQKKQGINTDQLGKGKEGFVKFIEVALKIITYLFYNISFYNFSKKYAHNYISHNRNPSFRLIRHRTKKFPAGGGCTPSCRESACLTAR